MKQKSAYLTLISVFYGGSKGEFCFFKKTTSVQEIYTVQPKTLHTHISNEHKEQQFTDYAKYCSM